jgi:sugar-specific transcriptional regulator TrmB
MINDFTKSLTENLDTKQISFFNAESDSKSYKQRMAVDKLKSALIEFGLSPNQSKVYIFLGKYGSKTAPEVSKTLQIQRTEVYHILNSLQSRGIVTAELISPTKYAALPIEAGMSILLNLEREKLNLLSKQKRNIVEMWNDIPSLSLETDDEEKEKMQVLQGTTSLNNKIMTMIRDCNAEFLMFGTEKDIARFYHADFFEILDTSNLKVRFIICPAKKIPDFIEEADKAVVRVLSDGKSDTSCFILKDSSDALLFTKNASYAANETTALWTSSKSIIDSMRLLFNCCWEKAEIIY